MESKNYLFGVVAVVLVIGALYYFGSGSSQQQSDKQPSVNDAPSAPAQSEKQVVGDKLIEISPNGFGPQDFTMKAGSTVTWSNVDTVDHEVRSNPHPQHDKFPQINEIGLLKPGEKKSIKIAEPGVYTYHDHLNPTVSGLKGSFKVEP